MTRPPGATSDPPPPADADGGEPDRREFMHGASLALAGALGLVGAVPVVTVLLDPLQGEVAVERGEGLIPVASVDRFEPGIPTQVEIRASKRDAWSNLGVVTIGRAHVTRLEGERFRVFSSRCPHQGCTVEFIADKDQFYCPCHKGFFKADGELADGPPKRGLDPLEHQVKEGTLWIRYQRFKTGTDDRTPE